jgi:hypothetical protein
MRPIRVWNRFNCPYVQEYHCSIHGNEVAYLVGRREGEGRERWGRRYRLHRNSYKMPVIKKMGEIV